MPLTTQSTTPASTLRPMPYQTMNTPANPTNPPTTTTQPPTLPYTTLTALPDTTTPPMTMMIRAQNQPLLTQTQPASTHEPSVVPNTSVNPTNPSTPTTPPSPTNHSNIEHTDEPTDQTSQSLMPTNQTTTDLTSNEDQQASTPVDQRRMPTRTRPPRTPIHTRSRTTTSNANRHR